MKPLAGLVKCAAPSIGKSSLVNQRELGRVSMRDVENNKGCVKGTDFFCTVYTISSLRTMKTMRTI